MSKKILFIFNIFIISALLSLNLYFVYFFKNFYFSIFASILTIVLYISIVKAFINDMYRSNVNLQKTMQQTMHEINTPVSTILMNTHMLQASCKDNIQLKQIKRIEDSCHNLLKLYENMEYFLQKEINQIELVRFNVQDIVQKSVTKFEDIKKNVIIEYRLQPFFIKIDKIGFELVIDNLLSNAFKHNKKLTIIKISLENNILKIKDDGDGIDIKNIYNTYDHYFQQKETKSSGLGLGIVKEFCENNNILVHIDSSENGTSVNLKFGDKVCQ